MKTKGKYTRLFALLLMLLMVFSLIGCTKKDSGVQDSSAFQDSSTAQDNSTVPKTPSDSVKSDGYDKFCQLKIGMTESEVNAILGDPTSVDKASYYYNIIVNGQDLELNVWISTVTGLVVNIYGDFYSEEYRAEFADSATDLSTASGLESGEISTYDACVTAFKTPGFLISIDEDGVKEYLWVNTNDGHMKVTIRADGSVKTYQGVC